MSSDQRPSKSGPGAQFFDEAFSHIAQRAGSVNVLLDEFFSFLHRRTDFYVQFPSPVDSNGVSITYKMGFPEGVAEKMVLQSFKKFPMKDYDEHEGQYSTTSPHKVKQPISPSTTPTKWKHIDRNDDYATTIYPITPSRASTQTSTSRLQYTAEGKQIPIGNGGVGPNYYWTQNLRELTIYIDVLNGPVTSKSVDCIIKASSLSLSVQGTPIVVGDLEETIRPSESTWTLNKGGNNEAPQVIITLEKIRETWWKRVIVGHPEIDTTKVTRNSLRNNGDGCSV